MFWKDKLYCYNVLEGQAVLLYGFGMTSCPVIMFWKDKLSCYNVLEGQAVVL